MTKTAHKPNEYTRKQRSKCKMLTSSNMDVAKPQVIQNKRKSNTKQEKFMK